MTRLIQIHDAVFATLERAADWLLPTLARLLFAGVLLFYFWNSAMTKVGDGLFGIFVPDDGAYIQIFPRVIEAIGYDFSQLGLFHWAVVLAGTWAEFLLPAMILLGLLTRIAALGMIFFVAVQSWVDVVGHGLGATDIGAWFDRFPSAALIDQRAFWVFVLLVLVLKGGGPFSLDRLLAERFAAPAIRTA